MMLAILLSVGVLLSFEGELERSLEILALLQFHPGCGHEIRVRAEKRIECLKPEVTPEEFSSSIRCGQEKSLETASRSVLIEFSAIEFTG